MSRTTLTLIINCPMAGKTVITYLIEGEPNGAQYRFIDNKRCKMFVIPRTKLPIISKYPEFETPAFYILIGEDENAKPKAYIGQTENFKERVKQHDNNKSFWQKALVFVSSDKAINKADVQYLEYVGISAATKAGNYVLTDNKQIPKAPNLAEYQQASMDDFFEDIKFLVAFLNCNVFTQNEQKADKLFYVKGRGSDARGIYNEDGFIVLRGSILANTCVPSFTWEEKRKKMLKEYAAEDNGKIILTTDKTFSSPSTAADFCIGSSNNGWLVWKDKNGKTLDEVIRKQKLD